MTAEEEVELYFTVPDGTYGPIGVKKVVMLGWEETIVRVISADGDSVFVYQGGWHSSCVFMREYYSNWLHEGPWKEDFLKLVEEVKKAKSDEKKEREKEIQIILGAYK